MAPALLFRAAMTTQAHQRLTLRLFALPAALTAGLLTGSGCHPTVTNVSISSAAIGGTIAGVITGPDDATLADRTVNVVNVDTGEQYQTATGQKGGYSLRVPPGTYRLEVQLRPGEQLKHAPTILLSVGGRDFHKDANVNQNQQ